MFVPSTSWDEVPGHIVRKTDDSDGLHKKAPLLSAESHAKRKSLSSKLLKKDLSKFGGFAPTELLLAPNPPPAAAPIADAPAPVKHSPASVSVRPKPAAPVSNEPSVPHPLPPVPVKAVMPGSYSRPTLFPPCEPPTSASSSLATTACSSPKESRKRKLPKAFADNPKPINSAPSSNFVYQDLRRSRKSGVKSNKGAESLRLKLTRQKNSRWREANGIIPRGRRAKQFRRIELAKEMAHEKSIQETISPESVCEMFSPGVGREVIEALVAGADIFENGKNFVSPQNFDSVEESELLEFLKINFGHSEFRTGQLAAIRAALSGSRSLVVLPTGTGKSLCYQFPSAFIRAKTGNTALTVVVSPLIALMSDQLKQLPSVCRGAAMHSNLSPAQSHLVARAIRAGQIDLLFLAPERLLMYSMQELLGEGGGSGGGSVFLVAVDEAHCLSEWSHSFRPAYLRIPKMIEESVRPKSLLALTATATVQTIDSISTMLGITHLVRADELIDSGISGTASASFKFSSIQRTNLELFARRSPNPSMDFLEFLAEHPTLAPIIIYVAYQWQTESISQMLRERGLGLAEGYHGGLTAKERKSVYEKFMGNQIRFVVATVAFGMGIDKSDVGAVVHLTVPKSVESYVQETGRCARKGDQLGFCRCYFNSEDFARIRTRMVVDMIRKDSVERVVNMAVSGEDLPEEGGRVGDEKNLKIIFLPEKIPNIISQSHMSLVLALVEKYSEDNAAPPVQVYQGFPRILKLRFFSASMAELADIDPFVEALFQAPHKTTKTGTVSEVSGVATVDVLKALATTGMDPPAFMHKLNACARAQKFSAAKSDWGHFVFSKIMISRPELAEKCFQAASANQLFELNRLDASFVLLSRVAAESIDDPLVGHKLIQQYFEVEERMKTGDDLVPSLLQGASDKFNSNMLRELALLRGDVLN